MYRDDTSIRRVGAEGHARNPRHAFTEWLLERTVTVRSRRTLSRVRTQRQVVDYTLRRRALLRDVYAGRVGTMEVCDASPYLIRASKFFGDATETPCPICRREPVWRVHYIYGDELRASAGQARPRAELALLAKDYRAFDVYVVEVCRGCGWNLLVEKFTLGRDGFSDDGDSRRRAAD